MMNTLIVDNTGRGDTPSVTSMFHDAVVAAIEAGGRLPEELADIITLTPLRVDGAVRWIVEWV